MSLTSSKTPPTCGRKSSCTWLCLSCVLLKTRRTPNRLCPITSRSWTRMKKSKRSTPKARPSSLGGATYRRALTPSQTAETSGKRTAHLHFISTSKSCCSNYQRVKLKFSKALSTLKAEASFVLTKRSLRSSQAFWLMWPSNSPST